MADINIASSSAVSFHERANSSPGERLKDEASAIENNRVIPAIAETEELTKATSAEKAEKGQQDVPEDELSQAIDLVSEFINQPPRNVNFLQDDDSGKTVVKVFDANSQELIKQFPSEEILSMAEKIKSLQQEIGAKSGLFINDTV